jgi:hypothetical protein
MKRLSLLRLTDDSKRRIVDTSIDHENAASGAFNALERVSTTFRARRLSKRAGWLAGVSGDTMCTPAMVIEEKGPWTGSFQNWPLTQLRGRPSPENSTFRHVLVDEKDSMLASEFVAKLGTWLSIIDSDAEQ